MALVYFRGENEWPGFKAVPQGQHLSSLEAGMRDLFVEEERQVPCSPFLWTNIIQNVFQTKKKVLILLYEEKIKSSIADTHPLLQRRTHHVR